MCVCVSGYRRRIYSVFRKLSGKCFCVKVTVGPINFWIVSYACTMLPMARKTTWQSNIFSFHQIFYVYYCGHNNCWPSSYTEKKTTTTRESDVGHVNHSGRGMSSAKMEFQIKWILIQLYWIRSFFFHSLALLIDPPPNSGKWTNM